MNVHILGDGSFGSFLKEELPKFGFKITSKCKTVILAVPISAYETLGKEYAKFGYHLINVCSVQEPSTNILLKITKDVTSIHPLFGARTPTEKRNSILTRVTENNNKRESEFLYLFSKFCKISCGMSPEEHDKLMAKTHGAALLAAKQAKHFIEAAEDIPDELIPNSFRLLREFVKTLDDMPSGTVESIMANPYI